MILNDKLSLIIETVQEKLNKINPLDSLKKPAPDKWSSNEILGHLIDSAVNNSRRFVLAQIQDNLIFDGYEHEEWVKCQNYQKRDWIELINTWEILNFHIMKIIETIPEELMKLQTKKHNFYDIAWEPVDKGKNSSLEYFINDYIGHMNHHLIQIFRLNKIEYQNKE